MQNGTNCFVKQRVGENGERGREGWSRSRDARMSQSTFTCTCTAGYVVASRWSCQYTYSRPDDLGLESSWSVSSTLLYIRCSNAQEFS